MSERGLAEVGLKLMGVWFGITGVESLMNLLTQMVARPGQEQLAYRPRTAVVYGAATVAWYAGLAILLLLRTDMILGRLFVSQESVVSARLANSRRLQAIGFSLLGAHLAAVSVPPVASYAIYSLWLAVPHPEVTQSSWWQENWPVVVQDTLYLVVGLLLFRLAWRLAAISHRMSRRLEVD